MKNQLRKISSVDKKTGEDELIYTFNKRKFKLRLHEDVAKPNTYSFFLLENLNLANVGRVLDIGTGTGILALVVAAQNPEIQVVATDINPNSVKTAKENVILNGLERQISVFEGDLFEPVLDDKFDLILCDPRQTPVPLDTAKTQLSKMRDFYLNTSGGLDGLEFIRELIENAPRHLLHNGRLQFVVVNYIGVEILQELLSKAGLKTSIDASVKTELSPMTIANRNHIEKTLNHTFGTTESGKEFMELLVVSGKLEHKKTDE